MLSKAQKKADRLWKRVVKEIAQWKCERCGKTKNQCQLHSHHFFGRTNRATRWDIRNGFCLCASCHKLSKHSAHENPHEFRDWAISLRGENWYEALRLQCHSVWDRNIELILTELQEKLAEY